MWLPVPRRSHFEGWIAQRLPSFAVKDENVAFANREETLSVRIEHTSGRLVAFGSRDVQGLNSVRFEREHCPVFRREIRRISEPRQAEEILLSYVQRHFRPGVSPATQDQSTLSANQHFSIVNAAHRFEPRIGR